MEWPESGSQGAGKPATRRFGRDLLKVPPPSDPGTMTGDAAVWSDLQQGRSPHSGRQRRSSAAEVVVESAGSRSLRSAIDSARPGTTQWLRFAGGNWDAAAARRRSKAAAAASQADAVPDDGSDSPVLSPPRRLPSPAAVSDRDEGGSVQEHGGAATGAGAGATAMRLRSIALRDAPPPLQKPRYTLEDVMPPPEGTAARERLVETLPAAVRPALASVWRERAAQAALLRSRSRRAQHWLSRKNAMLRALLAGRSADSQLRQWREARGQITARAHRLREALEDAADAVSAHCRELGPGSEAAAAAAAAHAGLEGAVEAMPVLAPPCGGPGQDRVGDMLAPAAHARSVMRRLRRQVARAAHRPPPRAGRGTVAAGVRLEVEDSCRRTAWDRKQGELESRWRARCEAMVRARPPHALAGPAPVSPVSNRRYPFHCPIYGPRRRRSGLRTKMCGHASGAPSRPRWTAWKASFAACTGRASGHLARPLPWAEEMRSGPRRPTTGRAVLARRSRRSLAPTSAQVRTTPRLRTALSAVKALRSRGRRQTTLGRATILRAAARLPRSALALSAPLPPYCTPRSPLHRRMCRDSPLAKYAPSARPGKQRPMPALQQSPVPLWQRRRLPRARQTATAATMAQ